MAATRTPKAGRSAATAPAADGAKTKAGTRARSGTNGAAGAKTGTNGTRAATATGGALDKGSPACRVAKAIVDRLAGLDPMISKWADMDAEAQIKLVRAAAKHLPEASTAPS